MKNLNQNTRVYNKNIGNIRLMTSIEDAMALVPLAAAGVSTCWRLGKKIRPASQIKKICVLLPEKCGKSTLCRVLGASEKVLVDCGEFAKVFDKDMLLTRLGSDLTLVNAVSDGLLDDVYEYVRKLVLRSKKEQAIFFTSNVDWAVKKFKPDAVYCLVPSCEFAKEIEGCEPSRSRILHTLPKEVVSTFNSWEELEGLLRIKFKIQHSI